MITKDRWSAESDARLKRLYLDGRTIWSIADLLRVTTSAIKNRIHNLKLKRNFFRRAYSEQETELLRQLYPDTPTIEIAKQMRRTLSGVYGMAKKLGLRKSAEYQESPAACRLRRGDKVGVAFRFPPGHVPANKGTRRPGYAPGRMASTQFKKGQRTEAANSNWCPIGTVKFNNDGYLIRKVADEANAGVGATNRNWEFVHKRVWVDAYGPIPECHRIWWKDKNHENCALENLELLSDAEHMRRTTIHNLPKPLKDTIMLVGRLKRRIRRRKREEQVKRSAESPVRDDRTVEGRRETDGSGAGTGSL